MKTATTATGGFPIGIRRLRSAWHQDLPKFLDYARSAGCGFVDFGPVDASAVVAAKAAELLVGTVDLPDWPGLLSPDAGVRKAAVISAASHIRSLSSVGISRFLSVLVPADPSATRSANMTLAIESYRSLAQAAAECGASILIEGAPGRPPHFANLACTPADLRLFQAGIDSSAVGVNFDPSHLVRMGIDPLRFLQEFGSRVGHVHAKDTLLMSEGQYQHGTLQQATESPAHVYGAWHWRYALPGLGAVPWKDLFQTLKTIGYQGGVSIELEDEAFLGDESREREGFDQTIRFLSQ